MAFSYVWATEAALDAEFVPDRLKHLTIGRSMLP